MVVIMMKRSALKCLVKKKWAVIINCSVLIDLQGKKEVCFGGSNNEPEGFEISSERQWDGDVGADRDFATGERGYLDEIMIYCSFASFVRFTCLANLNYPFDLDSIFVSMQEFFWTLEFFSLPERGGGS